MIYNSAFQEWNNVLIFTQNHMAAVTVCMQHYWIIRKKPLTKSNQFHIISDDVG